MGNYTTNLSLYNTDMNTDGNDTFDFQRDLNDNNDKIDSAIGKLSTLTTTDKSSLVNAIIEIVTDLGGKTSKSLDDLDAVGQAIIDKKVEVEALLQQNGYAKFSWKENNQISSFIIQWGVTETQKSTYFPTSFSGTGYTGVATVDYFSAFPSNITFSVTIGSKATSNCYFRGVSSGNTVHGMGFVLIGY